MWKADCASGPQPGPDRAGAAHRAAAAEAVAPGRGVEKAVAGGDVVAAAARARRPGRRSRQGAAQPSQGRAAGRRQRQPAAEGERAAVGDEEAEPGVDQQADRRAPGLARSAAPRR